MSRMVSSPVSGSNACDEPTKITSVLPEVGIDIEAALKLSARHANLRKCNNSASTASLT